MVMRTWRLIIMRTRSLTSEASWPHNNEDKKPEGSEDMATHNNEDKKPD